MKQAEYIKEKKRYSKQSLKKCLNFAQDVYPTIKEQLAKRGQTDIPMSIKQTMVGKIAEEFDEYWGTKIMGFDCLKRTDFEIYSGGKKDFSSDLVFGGDKAREYFDLDKKEINVSCKACFYRIGNKYTEYINGESIPVMLPSQYSWVYQLSNNGGVGGHDNGNHDVYIFNIVDLNNMKVGAYAWVVKDTVSKMFIRPFMESKKESKLVVQQETCGGLRHFPCGIDELLDTNYEPKESI